MQITEAEKPGKNSIIAEVSEEDESVDLSELSRQKKETTTDLVEEVSDESSSSSSSFTSEELSLVAESVGAAHSTKALDNKTYLDLGQGLRPKRKTSTRSTKALNAIKIAKERKNLKQRGFRTASNSLNKSSFR